MPGRAGASAVGGRISGGAASAALAARRSVEPGLAVIFVLSFPQYGCDSVAGSGREVRRSAAGRGWCVGCPRRVTAAVVAAALHTRPPAAPLATHATPLVIHVQVPTLRTVREQTFKEAHKRKLHRMFLLSGWPRPRMVTRLGPLLLESGEQPPIQAPSAHRVPRSRQRWPHECPPLLARLHTLHRWPLLAQCNRTRSPPWTATRYAHGPRAATTARAAATAGTRAPPPHRRGLVPPPPIQHAHRTSQRFVRRRLAPRRVGHSRPRQLLGGGREGVGGGGTPRWPPRLPPRHTPPLRRGGPCNGRRGGKAAALLPSSPLRRATARRGRHPGDTTAIRLAGGGPRDGPLRLVEPRMAA